MLDQPTTRSTDTTHVRAMGVVALLAWMAAFSAGILVPSEGYRLALLRIDTSTSLIEIASNAAIAAVLFGPLNVAYLCLLAGFIGGCVANVTWTNLDASTRTEADPRRLAYLRESPFNAMLRSFVVYLILVGGLFAFLPDPFGINSSSREVVDPSARQITEAGFNAAAMQQASYARLAALASVLAFVIGFDPTRLQGLFDMIPVVGRKPKREESSGDDAESPQPINGSRDSAGSNGSLAVR